MGWKKIFADFFDKEKRALRNVKNGSDALNEGSPYSAIAYAKRAMKQNPNLASPHDIIGMSFAVLAKKAAKTGVLTGENGANECDRKAVAAFQKAAQLGSKSAKRQLDHWEIPLENPDKNSSNDIVSPWIIKCGKCKREYIIGINCFASTDDDVLQMGSGYAVSGNRTLKPDLIGKSGGNYQPPPEVLTPEQLKEHQIECKAIIKSLDSGTKRSWSCNTCGYKSNRYPATPRWG